jgi:hypothetical protein
VPTDPVLHPEVPDPDDGAVFLTRFVSPSVPMPDGCLFQLAPDDRLVLRIYDDGSVEFGEGVSPPEASRRFWAFLGTLR